MSHRVIWPAPCHPALVRPGSERLWLLVRGEDEQGELAAWAEHLQLRAPEQPPIRLTPAAVREASADEIDQFADAWRASSSPEERTPAVVELEAEASLFGPPDGPRVYDLARGETTERSRAVAPMKSARRLRVALASDLHIARAFRDVLDDIASADADLAERLTDPDAQLDTFIAEANALADRGELDVVVLGGDLVDHGRPDRASTAESSNARRLARRLESLRVPTFAVPGNHDHRLYAWRPRIGRFTGSGVSRPRLRAALRAAGHWDKAPLRPADYDAVRTASDEFSAPLFDFARELSPLSRGGLRIGPLELLFANTGADAALHWRGLERSRLPTLVRAHLAHGTSEPPSEGLAEGEVAWLADAIARAPGAAIFCHAPAFALAEGVDAADLRGPLDAIADGRPVRADAALRKAGIAGGSMLRGGAALIGALARADRPVALFSGHIHRASGAALDLASKRAHATPLQALPDSPIGQATAPALGVWGDGEAGAPGYLLATFEDGALVSLARRAL